MISDGVIAKRDGSFWILSSKVEQTAVNRPMKVRVLQNPFEQKDLKGGIKWMN